MAKVKLLLRSIRTLGPTFIITKIMRKNFLKLLPRTAWNTVVFVFVNKVVSHDLMSMLLTIATVNSVQVL